MTLTHKLTSSVSQKGTLTFLLTELEILNVTSRSSWSMPLPLMVFESIKERGCDYKEMFGARCEEHKSAALCEVHQEGYLSAPEEPTVISSYSKFQISNCTLRNNKTQLLTLMHQQGGGEGYPRFTSQKKIATSQDWSQLSSPILICLVPLPSVGTGRLHFICCTAKGRRTWCTFNGEHDRNV